MEQPQLFTPNRWERRKKKIRDTIGFVLIFDLLIPFSGSDVTLWSLTICAKISKRNYISTEVYIFYVKFEKLTTIYKRYVRNGCLRIEFIYIYFFARKESWPVAHTHFTSTEKSLFILINDKCDSRRFHCEALTTNRYEVVDVVGFHFFDFRFSWDQDVRNVYT